MTSKQATGMKLWVDQLSGAPLELGASSREVPSSEVRLIAVREGSCYLFARNEKNGEDEINSEEFDGNVGEEGQEIY